MEKKSLHKVICVLSIAVGLIALYSALRGILNNELYLAIHRSGILPKNMIWGSQAQDIVSILIAVTTVIISILNWVKPRFLKKCILIGCNWYFMYAFGLYVVQGSYTAIYPLYLVIFSLSMFAMIFGLISVDKTAALQLSKKLRITLSVFFLFVVAFLSPIWISKMLGDVALRQPGNTYGVYIMDLCIVFPSMLITVYLLLKKNAFGIVLAGICLVKTFTLCLSWTFAEWTQPLVGQPVGMEMASISMLLSLIGLALFVWYTRVTPLPEEQF